jgi:hypothetical protein
MLMNMDVSMQAVSQEDVAAILSKVLGERIEHVEIPAEDAKEGMIA